MRRIPAPRVGHGPDDRFYGIGGRAELTSVTAGGVRTDVLRTWTDEVGRTIAV